MKKEDFNKEQYSKIGVQDNYHTEVVGYKHFDTGEFVFVFYNKHSEEEVFVGPVRMEHILIFKHLLEDILWAKTGSSSGM